MMNIKLVKWLISHQEILLKVVEIAKNYNPSLSYLEQWDIADKIARIVIPALQAELVTSQMLEVDWAEDETAGAFALGAEAHALGIDWKLIAEVLLPILSAILQVLKESDQ